MRGTPNTETERGQAHTLEGFIGAMVVLMAVLFAVQSVVITPTTGGAVDRTVQSQLQGETQDALIVADSEGDLSEMVRYWNVSEDETEVAFADADAPGSSRGEYTTETFREEFRLGEILEKRFGEQGQNYNVELHTPGDMTTLVYQGQPSSSAFTASYTLTLYGDQNLTAPGYEEYTLKEAADGAEDGPPIENDSDADVHVYNVVEVRVIVW